jgi:sn-glycerol 3-phosphate transport system substrate-binding protein
MRHRPVAPPPVAPPPVAPRPTAPVAPAAIETTQTGNRKLLVGAVIAVVALLAGAGILLSRQDGDELQTSGAPDSNSVVTTDETSPSSQVTTTADSTTPPTTQPIAPTPLVLPAGDPVQIQLLNPGIQSVVLDELVRGFESENPDISVEIVENPGYQATLELLLNGDVQPDVALLADRAVQSVLDQLDFLPVRDFIARDDFDASRLLANAADMYSTADGLAAMPFNVSTSMMYANGALLERAGIELEPGASLTTAGLLDRCTVLAEYVDTCIEIGSMAFLFTELVTNSGGRMFDTDGFAGSATAGAFDTEVGRASFAFLVDSVVAGDARVRSGARLFESGEAAFYMNTSSGLGSIDRANDEADEPVDLVPIGLPHVDGVESTGVMPGGGALWIFDRGDERRSIASWLLVEYLVELPQLEVYHRASGYVPGRADAASEDSFVEFWSEKPVFQGAYDELVEASTLALPNDRDGRAGPFHEVDEAIGKRLEQAQSGESTTDVAFDALVVDVNTLLASYAVSNG